MRRLEPTTRVGRGGTELPDANVRFVGLPYGPRRTESYPDPGLEACPRLACCPPKLLKPGYCCAHYRVRMRSRRCYDPAWGSSMEQVFDDPRLFCCGGLKLGRSQKIRVFTASPRSRVSCSRTCCLRKRAIRILVEAHSLGDENGRSGSNAYDAPV